MKTFLFLAIIWILVSCNNHQVRYTSKRVQDKIVKSKFIDDSIFDGMTSYYNLDGHLESKIQFNRGLKNGVEINYYKNGKIFDSSYYKNGLRNGKHFVFDSVGKLTYTDTYINGEQFGERIFYQNGKVYQYLFSNFEKKDIYSCRYDSIGMTDYGGEIITANIYKMWLDNIPSNGLFAYFLNPPHVQIIYSLGLINKKDNSQKEITVFDNGRTVIDTSLNIPPIDCKYFISANYYDSLNNFRKIYFSELEY